MGVIARPKTVDSAVEKRRNLGIQQVSRWDTVTFLTYLSISQGNPYRPLREIEMIMHESPQREKYNHLRPRVTAEQITDVSLLPSLQKYHIWNDS
jgi:hypothetical protein